MNLHSSVRLVIAGVVLALGQPVGAAVSPEEAAQLKTTLTPMGAERGGNKEGTIPEWTGGFGRVSPGYRNGDPRPDPFADEKPLFSITQQNMAQHSARLSEGTKAMLAKYPSYRVDVYKTHRTGIAPQWVYDNTFRNATSAHIVEGTQRLVGAYGGVPFPIPKTGLEVMWNRSLVWQGTHLNFSLASYTVVKGEVMRTVLAENNPQQFPYYRKDGSKDTWDGITFQIMTLVTEPPQRAGDSVVGLTRVSDQGVQTDAWQYLPGQRRTRKSPSIRYDYPIPSAFGASNYDDQSGFRGEMDRYEWKLVGKQEFYVPYNSNRFFLQPAEKVVGREHLNPDFIRWELHRTWVVEGTLLPGKRNVTSKRRLYIDEDTWATVMVDTYDANGQLWRVAQLIPLIAPDVPAVIVYASGMHDLLTGNYAMTYLPAGLKSQLKVLDPVPNSYFSPENMSTMMQR